MQESIYDNLCYLKLFKKHEIWENRIKDVIIESNKNDESSKSDRFAHNYNSLFQFFTHNYLSTFLERNIINEQMQIQKTNYILMINTFSVNYKNIAIEN